MDGLDPSFLIEWIYDWLEPRYGRTVAWFGSLGCGLAIVGMLIAILLLVVS